MCVCVYVRVCMYMFFWRFRAGVCVGSGERTLDDEMVKDRVKHLDVR